MGTIITIGGVVGGIVNVIIFLSLQIYRQSSSAFYLTVVSIVNIGQLLTGLLSRVLINICNVDWTANSLAYCKIRNYSFQACAIISPACLCLATIDQFLATSTRPQWQRWSNTKMAHRLTVCTVIFWLIYGTHYAVYYNLVVSSTTGTSSCVITNAIFQEYYNDFHVPVLMCVIPLFITILFGSLAYYNIRQLTHRTVPLVRRRHEVQLTVMVLVQVVFNFFATTPCFIVLTFASHTTLTSNPLIAIQVRFATAITTCIYYLYYAVNMICCKLIIKIYFDFLFRFHFIFIFVYLNDFESNFVMY